MRKLTLALALACSVFATPGVRAQVADPNHTVVHFEVLTGGTSFGSVDIELFDQEKPETVKNFLLYVYSGGYSNLVLQRLVPNFVLQAGHIRVEDPSSTNAFTTYPEPVNYGRITNEYSVGPQLSNDYGTIAMARVSGETNSATYDWYVNLTNNPALDAVDGGFTVFGRVVNTTTDRTGTNLLNYFNTLTNGHGIRSVSISTYGEQLSNLPVSTNRPQYAAIADLFTVRATIIQGGQPQDTFAPSLQVTQPAEGETVTTNSMFLFTGTASDNQAIARVLYDTPFEHSLIAAGREAWSVQLPINVGTNRYTFRSVDYFGNVSSNVERVIVRQERPPDPNHTVVRFNILTGGTNFGKLDIELYDDVKPETVRNFLMYVYSGAYSNLALAQLVPGRFLQGGHVQLNNTDPGLDFVTYDVAPNFGLVANEYDTGNQLPNEFGTIATAAIPGKGNTTSNEWQINLGNNTSLNTGNGGSTVFGRVVNSDNERSGIYLLNLFNTYENGVNLRGFNLQFETFSIPVTIYAGSRPPKRKEMFFVNASIIQRGMPHDNIEPIVQINEPAETGLIMTTNSTVTLSGTASDNQEIARVIYDAPSGPAQLASGRTNWTADVTLMPGTNDIVVRGVDYFGNVGSARRTVLLSHPQHLNLQVSGKGKVTGLPDDRELLVGVNYTVSAKPGARQYFLGWQNQNSNIVSRARTLNFTMQEDLTNLTAVFSRTMLGLSNGVYKGVFFPTTNGPSRSAGTVTLNLAPNGSYSGRLAPLGASYTIRGRFDTNGNTVITGQRNQDVLALVLSFFSTETMFGDYIDGNHSRSSVGMWYVPKFSTTNPCPQAGAYSFLISPTLDAQTAVVSGYGFGNVTVDVLGRIEMNGTLGDGTVIRQKSNLLVADNWAFFASARSGREVVVGAASFTTNHLFGADLKWFSSEFPGKTNQNARMNGSLYVAPSAGAPLFNWTLGVVSISGGGLPAAVFADLELNADGTFTIPNNPNNIQLSAPDANGTITGSFTDPVSSALTPLQGAVLQSSNMAAGFFPGSAGTGAFVIRAR